ncbi:MAG: hypothetical protein KGR26_04305, partial [Cyanobacteria bacterium REEB65]|nr:hypothetical protein [Cyanobacteria bacterium REEB65]
GREDLARAFAEDPANVEIRAWYVYGLAGPSKKEAMIRLARDFVDDSLAGNMLKRLAAGQYPE